MSINVIDVDGQMKSQQGMRTMKKLTWLELYISPNVSIAILEMNFGRNKNMKVKIVTEIKNGEVSAFSALQGGEYVSWKT